ncbi:HDOD domain-containing protein [bacterium]|nr:HDOD domain-containing protein [bacterium]
MKKVPLKHVALDPRLQSINTMNQQKKKSFWEDTRIPNTEHSKPTIAQSSFVSKRRLTEDIIARINELPSLPTVVLKIMELIQDDTSSASAIEKYLRQDPGLTARLLRLVNSSFFGLRHKVASIPQAIMIVGYSSLKSLVLAASTSPLFKGAFPGYGLKTAGLWQHSFLTAAWAQKFAKELGWAYEDAEEVFVAGLLHDIGKMIMSTYINEHCQEMYTALFMANGQLTAAEKTLTGIDHTEIGGRIAKKWNFSEKLEFIIKAHHDLSVSSISEKEVSLIQLVNNIVTKTGFGMYENFPLNNNLPELCLKTLEISPDTIEELQRKVISQGEITASEL